MSSNSSSLATEVSPPQDKGILDGSHDYDRIMDVDRYDSVKDESPDDKLAHAQNAEPESTEGKMKFPPSVQEAHLHV